VRSFPSRRKLSAYISSHPRDEDDTKGNERDPFLVQEGGGEIPISNEERGS